MSWFSCFLGKSHRILFRNYAVFSSSKPIELARAFFVTRLVFCASCCADFKSSKLTGKCDVFSCFLGKSHRLLFRNNGSKPIELARAFFATRLVYFTACCADFKSSKLTGKCHVFLGKSQCTAFFYRNPGMRRSWKAYLWCCQGAWGDCWLFLHSWLHSKGQLDSIMHVVGMEADCGTRMYRYVLIVPYCAKTHSRSFVI